MEGGEESEEGKTEPFQEFWRPAPATQAGNGEWLRGHIAQPVEEAALASQSCSRLQKTHEF